MLPILRHRTFRTLCFAEIVALTGSGLATVALALTRRLDLYPAEPGIDGNPTEGRALAMIGPVLPGGRS